MCAEWPDACPCCKLEVLQEISVILSDGDMYCNIEPVKVKLFILVISIEGGFFMHCCRAGTFFHFCSICSGNMLKQVFCIALITLLHIPL